MPQELDAKGLKCQGLNEKPQLFRIFALVAKHSETIEESQRQDRPGSDEALLCKRVSSVQAVCKQCSPQVRTLLLQLRPQKVYVI